MALPLTGAPTSAIAVSGARRVAAAGAQRQSAGAAARTLDPASLPDHVDRLYRAAWALSGSRDEAEDLVQETFARVLAKPRLIRGDDDLGYLLRVLRNTFLTSRRTASRRPRTVGRPEDIEPADRRTGASAESALEAKETFAAIAGLPPKYREALVAVDVVGLSYREAARALGTREATITSRLFRARQQVVGLLDGSRPDGVL
ncbi:MAG: RNA polymerase sigma factor [Solirubrobacteraceae bacterium]